MKRAFAFLVLLSVLLSGCSGLLPGASREAPTACNTSRTADTAGPTAEIMPRQSELPEGFEPVACDKLVEDEGYSAAAVARLYGITQGWPTQIAIFTGPSQKVYFFTVAPIYTEDRQTINSIMNSATRYVAFRMANAGVSVGNVPQIDEFGEDAKLGDQFTAFGFMGRFNELNLPVPQRVFHDLLLVRRGAVLFGIESVYGLNTPPALSREKLLELGQKMDERMKNVVAQNAQWNTVTKAPIPDWTTAASAAAEKYAPLAGQYPDLPGDFSENGEPISDLIVQALGSWMGRAVSYAQFTGAGGISERVQAVVIYPLDAQEQETFRRLLQSQDEIAGYLIKPLTVLGALTPGDDLSKYYDPLPDAEALKGAGDAAAGFTLTAGEREDTAVVLEGNALVVVMAAHPEGSIARVNAARYAVWLAGQVKNTPVE